MKVGSNLNVSHKLRIEFFRMYSLPLFIPGNIVKPEIYDESYQVALAIFTYIYHRYFALEFVE
jgi:hypothetical protein